MIHTSKRYGRTHTDGKRKMRGGFGGARGEKRGGLGGRRRMFDGGELRLMLLHLMEAQPRYGYDLIRDIEARAGGAYVPSPGIVYPTLTMLEELEHIAPETGKAEGGRRAFSLTPQGRAWLDTNRAELEAALARLDALRVTTSQTEAGPVQRAMQNLKTVLHQRLGATTDRETIFQVAGLIDDAARKIERLP